MQDAIAAILAHPDDAEILCGGTLIRLARQRHWQVHIATLTAGDCGSAELGPDDIARIRQLEGAAAAQRIGAHYHCLEERDLLVFYEQKPLARVTRLLRDVRPRIVLTHSPADYMLDHEMTSAIVRAAAFAAPIPNFLREAGLGAPLQHIPHLYYCDPIEGKDALGREVPPGFCIDISAEIDEKAALLACHASQRDWLRKHHGMDHYIEAMRAWSAAQGQRAGVAYAEGFRQHLGHSYPQDNLLGQLLSATEVSR